MDKPIVLIEASGDQHNRPPPASIITEMITLQTLCIVLQCTSYFTIEECLRWLQDGAIGETDWSGINGN